MVFDKGKITQATCSEVWLFMSGQHCRLFEIELSQMCFKSYSWKSSKYFMGKQDLPQQERRDKIT